MFCFSGSPWLPFILHGLERSLGMIGVLIGVSPVCLGVEIGARPGVKSVSGRKEMQKVQKSVYVCNKGMLKADN